MMSNKMLFETPEAVLRQGETLFLKCPLYRAKKTIRPIYINKDLFKQYISNSETSWEQMSSTLSQLFTMTLEIKESSGEQIGWAYVDRQSDPLELSLSGNEGSGRAYYTGRNFNIKGEKTPLATSTEVNHSNGVLAMNDGVWCTLIANSLYPSCKVSPVLAILDLQEDYTHPDKHTTVRKVKIIRMDIDGSLDRITHLFYLNKPLKQGDLLAMTQQFGQLDAHKFMQRIVHGSWSNGNISPKGHLIDYDSVCAVKGRQPQFSSSSYYIDNYFSFEFVGKLKVLESITASPQVNIDKIKPEILKEELIAARNQEIAIQLLYLMGYTKPELFSHYSEQLYSLAEQFKKLSGYVRYNRERSFFTNTPFHFFAHLIDFSNFLRYYPLLKLSKQFSVEAGFALLVQSELIPEDETAKIVSDFIEEPLVPGVLDYLKNCFISSEAQINQLRCEAYQFIEQFNDLFDTMLKDSHSSLLDIAKQAYLMNEDRFYLFPVFDLSKAIMRLALSKSAHEANDLIEQIIAASKRDYQKPISQPARTDLRIYEEGLAYIEVTDTSTFQLIFELNKDSLTIESADFTMAYKGKIYETSWTSIETGKIKIASTPIDIQELLVLNSRDEVFKLRKFELLSQGQPLSLQDYLGVDPKLRSYL